MPEKINIEGQEIAIKQVHEQDYISLTDMARADREESEPRFVIRSWIQSPDTPALLQEWEKTFNPNFKRALWRTFSEYLLSSRKSLTIKKYLELTEPLGIVSSSGRYGGTFAHVDIAFEFGTWLSPKFKIAMIQDYRRLKSEEYQRHKLEWSETRFLSKINAGILSASVKENQEHKYKNKSIPYASAFDMINIAVFGQTAKEWKAENPHANGNIRDNASKVELTLILNLESMNAFFIDAGASYETRLIRLCEIAEKQRKVLGEDKRLNEEKKFLP